MAKIHGPFVVGESGIDSPPQSKWEKFVKKEALATERTPLEAIGRWAAGDDPLLHFKGQASTVGTEEMMEHVDNLKNYKGDVAKQKAELRYWEDLGAETLRKMIRDDISNGSPNIYGKIIPTEEARGSIPLHQGYWWDNNPTYYSDRDFHSAIEALRRGDRDFDQELIIANNEGRIPVRTRSLKDTGRAHKDEYGFIKIVGPQHTWEGWKKD